MVAKIIVFENKTRKGVPSLQRIADHSPPKDDTFLFHFLYRFVCSALIYGPPQIHVKPFILFFKFKFRLDSTSALLCGQNSLWLSSTLIRCKNLIILLARLHFCSIHLWHCVLIACYFVLFLFQSLPVAIVCSPNDLPSIQKEMVKIILLRLI